MCYAQSSLRGLEVLEARGSRAPGILTPRGWDGECESRRTGLGGKGEDSPLTANPPLNITVYTPRSLLCLWGGRDVFLPVMKTKILASPALARPRRDSLRSEDGQ